MTERDGFPDEEEPPPVAGLAEDIAAALAEEPEPDPDVTPKEG